jgi:hypothetical protein
MLDTVEYSVVCIVDIVAISTFPFDGVAPKVTEIGVAAPVPLALPCTRIIAILFYAHKL